MSTLVLAFAGAVESSSPIATIHGNVQLVRGQTSRLLKPSDKLIDGDRLLGPGSLSFNGVTFQLFPNSIFVFRPHPEGVLDRWLAAIRQAIERWTANSAPPQNSRAIIAVRG